jgi:hypothetical protein
MNKRIVMGDWPWVAQSFVFVSVCLSLYVIKAVRTLKNAEMKYFTGA